MGSRLGDQLDMLLKAVLSKLQGAQTLTVAQSLIMVYAHLVHSQLEAVLAFLSSVPGPTGASALQFVLGEWVGKQQQFFGCYESKVLLCVFASLGLSFIPPSHLSDSASTSRCQSQQWQSCCSME